MYLRDCLQQPWGILNLEKFNNLPKDTQLGSSAAQSDSYLLTYYTKGICRLMYL